ncbi:malonyl-CoA synthase [Leucothrix sargassi]|nr:malonyl-CoA synthase [Leucothrix sargassi]
MYEGNFLAQHLRASSIGRDNSTFAETLDGTVTSYGDFFAGAERLAGILVEKGVKPNDRVAVQVDKSVEVLQLYVATVMAGGVFLPLNTAYTATEVSYFLGDATPAVFVCKDDTKSELQAIAEQSGVVALETLNADGSGSLTEAASQFSGEFSAVPRESNDLAAILYTSGTTGRSKGAMLTHENLWSNGSTLRDYWKFSSDDTLIHALPIFHTHGLFVAINVTLAAGSSLIFMTGFDVDAIMKSMSRATVLMGVPTFYVRLLTHPELSKDSVKDMRLFVSGSAPLLAETHEQWSAKTGTAILERYGMTETNMNTSNPYDGARRPGTVGFPLPGVEVRITNVETEELLPVGAVGAIEVRGPNVFQGYWQMPEKTAEELRDNGFFITGDLGMVDEQGYVSIIGRSKDLIITGGYNVYPKEIELLIDDLEGVNESAVIGLPHPDFGEAVSAVVVRQAGSQVSEDEIKQALSADIAKYKQPKQVFFVDELPRNAMGKVQKKALRETYGERFSS